MYIHLIYQPNVRPEIRVIPDHVTQECWRLESCHCCGWLWRPDHCDHILAHDMTRHPDTHSLISCIKNLRGDKRFMSDDWLTDLRSVAACSVVSCVTVWSVSHNVPIYSVLVPHGLEALSSNIAHFLEALTGTVSWHCWYSWSLF